MRRIVFPHPPAIVSHASVVGHEEARGPLGAKFDYRAEDDSFGADTWEHAEREMGRIALNFALKKRGLSHKSLDFIAAGDLQNQCVATSEGTSEFGVATIGLYGACSTLVEGLIVSSLALSSGSEATGSCAVVTSSHNCAAERQFRTPLEYGGQRTPTAQWTVTACGAYILARGGSDLRITEGMIGRPINGGVRDLTNMGAAMAPAAADTLSSYFSESGMTPEDFDAIVTGDLGYEGGAILDELLYPDYREAFSSRHFDCGRMMFDEVYQDAHCGGSGCGCIASILSANFLPMLERREARRILAVATGALMSPSSVYQGGTIIGIAPLIKIEVI